MALSKRNKNILIGMLCFVIIVGVLMVIMPVFLKKPYDNETYHKLKYSGENVIVLTPRFTEAAYSDQGFYNYYDGTCDKECLSIPLNKGRADRWGSYNLHTVQLLKDLGYPIMTDVDAHYQIMLDENYLNYYDTIILLHSEYVTKELFQAITSHKHVIYLAPNALYAEIEYNGLEMKLVRGHGYPDDTISNGFDWKHDNTPDEYDLDCVLWNFKEIDNGYQLNCAQEMYSQQKPYIMERMKELIKSE